jgi:hypothetical protein
VPLFPGPIGVKVWGGVKGRGRADLNSVVMSQPGGLPYRFIFLLSVVLCSTDRYCSINCYTM